MYNRGRYLKALRAQAAVAAHAGFLRRSEGFSCLVIGVRLSFAGNAAVTIS